MQLSSNLFPSNPLHEFEVDCAQYQLSITPSLESLTTIQSLDYVLHCTQLKNPIHDSKLTTVINTPQPTTMAVPTPTQLSLALLTLGIPTPHPAFLTSILSSTRSPLPALTATAKHRLLSSDFTSDQILAPSTPCFPPNLSSPSVQTTVLGADIPVQVLGIEDLGRSKWEQIESLEMERKGEMTKGREVIRVVAPDAENEPSTAATQIQGGRQAEESNGPFKLELQDVRGQKVYGFELKRVEKVGYPPVMGIGCKVVLKKGCRVARGMVLLEPGTVVVLGGRIERAERRWVEGREKALRVAVGEGRREDGD